jgi:aminobenzoyl-glutamate transport protein
LKRLVRKWLNRMLALIERVGNALPHPATLFALFALSIIVLSWVIPRLGEYKGAAQAEEIRRLTGDEKRGLIYAGIASLALVLILVWGTVPDNGFLRNPETGSLLRSPFLSGIVAIIFLGAFIAGVAYGIGARTIKNDAEVMKGMGKSIETLGVYVVLCFFAAQFVAYFKWTNLGLIFAIEGAGFLQGLGLGPIPLMITFIILSAVINLVMGSASAKWAIMAPVFIPMFMILGYAPELVQATYRIGDSITNIISPMMSYFPLIVAFMEKYDKEAGIGTVIATMLPYTFVYFLIWMILFIIWVIFSIPVGPGANLYIPIPQ